MEQENSQHDDTSEAEGILRKGLADLTDLKMNVKYEEEKEENLFIAPERDRDFYTSLQNFPTVANEVENLKQLKYGKKSPNRIISPKKEEVEEDDNETEEFYHSREEENNLEPENHFIPPAPNEVFPPVSHHHHHQQPKTSHRREPINYIHDDYSESESKYLRKKKKKKNLLNFRDFVDLKMLISFHKAASEGRIDKLRKMLQVNRALIKAEDDNGWTGLEHAIARGKKKKKKTKTIIKFFF